MTLKLKHLPVLLMALSVAPASPRCGARDLPFASGARAILQAAPKRIRARGPANRVLLEQTQLHYR